MIINTRNRSELQQYFRKNAIPTETQFGELFAAMINQRDDGVVKQSNSPLSIQAVGVSDNTSDRQVLHLYSNLGSEKPDWRFSLNPRTDLNNPATAKLGLSISDSTGTSRLFIDSATGNIGIGTINPQTKIDIRGDVSWGLDSSNTLNRDDAGLQGPAAKSGFFQTAGPTPAANWYSGATGWQHLLDIRHSNNTNNHALQIAGSFFDQNLYFRKTNNDPKTPWNRFVYENASGNVGIGTTDPQGKLDVRGDIRAGNSDIYFTKTDHQHSGIGNQEGFAAIENATNYNTLMILGRTTKLPDGTTQRRVGVWDKMEVHGDLSADGYIMGQPVYFSAYLKDNGLLGNLNPLPMQAVSQNIGNAYNAQTSKFTAPVKGVYLFTLTALSVGLGYVQLHVMVNGSHANNAPSFEAGEPNGLYFEPTDVSMRSRTFIISLNKGDLVHVKQDSPPVPPAALGTGRCDNYRTSFEGILISAVPASFSFGTVATGTLFTGTVAIGTVEPLPITRTP